MCLRTFCVMAAALGLAAASATATTVTFQEGVNLTGTGTPFAGTSDTFVQQDPANASTNNGAAQSFGWDGDDPGGSGNDAYGLIRFDGIFGAGAGLIPPGQQITQATLFLTVFDTGDSATIHHPTSAWTESSTYNSFCGAGCNAGVQYGSSVGSISAAALAETSVDVTNSIQSWQDGQTNNGWIIIPGGPGGVDVRSSEYTTAAQRPRLVVRYGEGPPAGGTLERDAYLQFGTPTSMTVCWRTSTATNSRVNYGTVQGSLTLTADNAAISTDHTVTINGLSPSTRYYYSVGSTTAVQGGGTANYYFETSPPTGPATPFSFWAVGDGGNGTSTQINVMNAMLADTAGSPPDFIVHLGDIAYTSGTDSEFTTNHFAPYAPVLRHSVLWPTLGNHEGASTTSGACWPLPCSPGATTGPYYDAFVLPTNGEAGGVASGTEAYYSFDYANVHFICLNSYEVSRSPSGPMAQWLQADLAATTQEWLIAFWHHPPYTKGTHNSDTESELREMRENFLPILEAGGVDLVLSGHSHCYERSYLIDGFYNTPTVVPGDGEILDSGDGDEAGDGAYEKNAGLNAHEGAVYVVAGHGGQSTGGSLNHPVMYHSESQFGSCVVSVDGGDLTLRNVRFDGVITDTFSIHKGDLPPRIVSETPAKGAVISGLNSVSITFDRDVTGVDAADLTVNGSAATALNVISASQYAFSGFASPAAGLVAVEVAAGGITDANNGALTFTGSSWTYTLDTAPPAVSNESPSRGTNVAVLNSITVEFSKPVINVSPDDLLVDGAPATTLVGQPGSRGPYIFTGFPTPGDGTVTVQLLQDGIQDDVGQPFAGDSWTYTLSTRLVINEFLASNNTTNTDENGGFDDWLEIYNPGGTAVDMSGMYLTDSLGFASQYRIPNGVTIPAGGYLVFWCDSTPSEGPLHTNFNLSRTGEDIGLYDTQENGFALIDGFSFPTQTTDVTSGRLPNGSGPIVTLAMATPGASNGGEPPSVDPLPIQVGDEWRYFKGTAEPSPGNLTAWRQIAFDDSSWATGGTGIGYADCTPATVLGDMLNGYVSVYARKKFTISNPANISSLTMTVDYDDGFVAYINGVEVARQYVTGNPPAFNAVAAPPGGNHECGTAETFNLNAFIPNLVAGTNVIAIQGHNVSASSSDFALIPTLNSTVGGGGGPVCGDGNLDAGEECDDGNTSNGDGCNSTCHIEPVTVTFQQGANGYSGTVDTFLNAGAPTANNSAATTLVVDLAPSVQQVLMRFDNIFGTNPGQIPPGATIQSATLRVNITNASAAGANLHRMAQSWNATDNWNTFSTGGGGIQAGTECLSTADVSSLLNSTGLHSITVTNSVTAWLANPATNFGWAWLPPATDDSWQFDSAEAATAGNRPLLTVVYIPAALCGNGDMDPGEECDDGNTSNGDGCDSTCHVEPVCGNGSIEGGEECDDGVNNSDVLPDACRTDCTSAGCGDGVQDAGEECDDGNTANGDGCDSTCQLEPVCGDGVAEGSEQCDDGAGNSDTLPDACRTNCTNAHCGDGVQDTGEACDDGNMSNGDGCNSVCQIEPITLSFQQGTSGYTGQADTFINAGAPTANNAAVTPLVVDLAPNIEQILLRFDNIFGINPNQIPPGAVIQSATLRINVTNASAAGANLHRMTQSWNDTDNWNTFATGGNGIQPGVECLTDPDVSSLLNATGLHTITVTNSVAAWSAAPAGNFGWAWLPPATDDSWQFDSAEGATVSNRPLLTVVFLPATNCGNGDLDPGEECDDGNNTAGDGCDATCHNEPVCGNGTVEFGEACDEGVNNSDVLPDACRTDCTAPACGDGVTDTGEECDDGNLTNGDGCNAFCETEVVQNIAAGDIIISGFQASNTPTGQNPGEFIELFNTTAQTIALDNLQLLSRLDVGGNNTLDLDWQLSASLAGKTIAPHSFFLIAESAVAAPGGNFHDVTADLDLATGEGGPGEMVIQLELVVDGVHMDYVLYGNELAPQGGLSPMGDIPFNGSSFPRAEVIRATAGTGFNEGMTRRVSPEDLYAGHDVEGYYADEDALPGSFPNGVWTSVHSDTNGSYQARNSLSPAVLAPNAATLMINLTVEGLGGDGVGAPYAATTAHPAGDLLDRPVELLLTTCGNPVDARNVVVTFSPSGPDGVGTVVLTGEGITTDIEWVAAREGHTLRSLGHVTWVNEDGAASLVLRSGDLQTGVVSQDGVVDIIDFSILAARWNVAVAADSAFEADINGDGIQATADFQALQTNYFEVGDGIDNCDNRSDGQPDDGIDTPDWLPLPVKPVRKIGLDGEAFSGISAKRSISLADLGGRVAHPERADMDGNGIVDARDIRAFATRNRLTIKPEFDRKLRSMVQAQEGVVETPVPAPKRATASKADLSGR